MLYSVEVLKTEGRVASSRRPLLAMTSLPGLGPRPPCLRRRCCCFRRKQRLLAALSASTGLSLLLLLLLHTTSSSSSSSSSSILPSKSTLEHVSRELPEKSHYIRDFIAFQDVVSGGGSSSLRAAVHASDRRRPQRVSDEGKQNVGEERTRDRRPRVSGGRLEPQTVPRGALADWKHTLLESRAPRHSMGGDASEVATRRAIDSPTEVSSIRLSKNFTGGFYSPARRRPPVAAGVPGLATAPGSGDAAGRGPRERNRSPPLLLAFDYSRPAYFPWRTTRDECANFATRFLVGGRAPLVAVPSFPGSGNTWLRYLAEALTGVFTGSVYHDEALALKGFWGERDGYRQGTTLLQKTHNFPLLPDEMKDGIYNGEEFRFLLPKPPRKVVLLMRSPWESLLALRHYHAAGHTGFGSSSFFRGPAWTNFTLERSGTWVKLNSAWLTLPSTDLHVIHYEHLQHRLEYEVERLMKFLGLPVDYGRVDCLLRYPEGRLRRPKYPKHLQGYHFPATAARILEEGMASVDTLLRRNGQPLLPTHLYTFKPLTDGSGDKPLVVMPA